PARYVQQCEHRRHRYLDDAFRHRFADGYAVELVDRLPGTEHLCRAVDQLEQHEPRRTQLSAGERRDDCDHLRGRLYVAVAARRHGAAGMDAGTAGGPRKQRAAPDLLARGNGERWPDSVLLEYRQLVRRA